MLTEKSAPDKQSTAGKSLLQRIGTPNLVSFDRAVSNILA
jgi:hypothetical protein